MKRAIGIRIIGVNVFFEFRVRDAEALFGEFLLGQADRTVFTYPILEQIVPFLAGRFAASISRATAFSGRGSGFAKNLSTSSLCCSEITPIQLLGYQQQQKLSQKFGVVAGCSAAHYIICGPKSRNQLGWFGCAVEEISTLSFQGPSLISAK